MLTNREKIEVIDTILTLYPHLKMNRGDMINKVLRRKEQSNMYLLERFNYKNTVLYRDPTGKVFDENIELQGCYFYKHGKPVYIIEKDLLTNDNELNKLFDLSSILEDKSKISQTDKNKHNPT